MEDILGDKKMATRYRVLLEVADRQPTVSQKEIADELNVTVQSVSEHLRGMSRKGYIVKEGRSRYQVTNEGVDWLISKTEDLEELTDYVNRKVIDKVDTELVLANDVFEEGEKVALTMEDGVLNAEMPPDSTDPSATAVTVSSARPGEVATVTDFEGILDYEPGEVSILTLSNSDEAEVGSSELVERFHDGQLTAVSGLRSLVAVRNSSVEVNVRYGTEGAVKEAANRGVDVLLVTVEDSLSGHTDVLREAGISYRVLD
ncbi:MAG: MarR family transcriptional regulator [Halobacteria archaeon]